LAADPAKKIGVTSKATIKGENLEGESDLIQLPRWLAREEPRQERTRSSPKRYLGEENAEISLRVFLVQGSTFGTIILTKESKEARKASTCPTSYSPKKIWGN